MRRLRYSLLALSMLLLSAPPLPAQTDGAGETPLRCASHAVGADTHTECHRGARVSPAPAIVCSTSKTGGDTHIDCAPVAGPIAIRASRPVASRALPTMPALPIRCSSYAIGSSVYTDCR